MMIFWELVRFRVRGIYKRLGFFAWSRDVVPPLKGLNAAELAGVARDVFVPLDGELDVWTLKNTYKGRALRIVLTLIMFEMWYDKGWKVESGMRYHGICSREVVWAMGGILGKLFHIEVVLSQ